MATRKKPFTLFLWALLFLALLLAAFSSMSLRLRNEKQNHTILSVADYEKFIDFTYQAGESYEDMVKHLKEAGIHAVGVKETSLRGLANQGRVTVDQYGNFVSYLQMWEPELLAKISALPGADTLNPFSLVISTRDRATGSFLNARLKARLAPDELLQLEEDDLSIFFIRTALSPLNPNVQGDTTLDMRIGFDQDLLVRLNRDGFDIVLRPGATLGSLDDYRREYEDVIEKFKIKTVVFANSVLKATPEDVEFFAWLTEKYGLTLGVIENSNQILYLEQDGLNDLMRLADYPINRTYSTSSDDYVKQKSERYYRWVRAVIDRGLRIMYIQPFNDRTKTIVQNLNDTYEITGQFHETIAEKGFAVTGDLPTLNASRPGKMNRMLIALSLVMGVILYLAYLLRLKDRWLCFLTLAGIAGAIVMNLLPMDWTKVYALAAACLYPTLSGLLVLRYLYRHPRASLLPKTVTAIVLMLGVNALGMMTIVTSLSDLRFVMYVKTFSGVKLSFMIPLLLFFVNYMMVFYRRQDLTAHLVRFARMKPNYLVLAIGAFFLVALYIYLGRSGNDSGITVSSLELRTREILEMLFLARPRFKEILIGYPCLMMMVYLYHRYRKSLILLPLGLGMMMGSVCMTNTFCHVFAAIQISTHRTLAGLFVGVIVGACFVALLMILERIAFLIWPGLKIYLYRPGKK